MKIVPAILENNPDAFKAKFERVATFSNIVQIDIADGIFVANKTVAVEDIVDIVEKSALEIEWHLMVEEPADLISRFKALKHKTIIFHHEVRGSHQAILSSVRTVGAKVGVALNPQTSADVVAHFSNQVDLVTVMAVEPGFQGSPFIPASLAKIKAIKKNFPNLVTEIDGGVNGSNLAQVVSSGVDQAVIGSGLWQSADPKAQFAKLTKLAKEVI